MNECYKGWYISTRKVRLAHAFKAYAYKMDGLGGFVVPALGADSRDDAMALAKSHVDTLPEEEEIQFGSAQHAT